MRQTFHILVTVDAGEFHGAMDGVLELSGVDEERDGLPVYVGGKRCVTMAGEAVFILKRVLGTSGEGRAQQKDCERTEQYSAGNFHAYEETPVQILLP